MKGRLGRLRRAFVEEAFDVRCPVCGERFRYAGDLALAVVVAQWARVAEGEEAAGHEEHPTVTLVLDHLHPALVDAILTDIPAFRRA